MRGMGDESSITSDETPSSDKHTMIAEEGTRDVDLLTPDHDDGLALEQLPCNHRGQTTQQMVSAIDQNKL